MARFCGGLVLAVLALPAAARAAIIPVPAGGNLQGALNAAQPGDTVVLETGATYVGNFVLPNKGGASYIVIMTSAAELPLTGARVLPTHARWMAKLRSPNGSPALSTAPGAHHWWIGLVEFQSNAGGAGDIITLGDGSAAQNTVAAVPHDLIIDRCYIHGDPGAPQKRGIALNSASTTITSSYISDIKAVGQDSQAIGGWNGPGPFTITNNYLEAAGENVMFGGADPFIPNLVPSDITVTNNTFSKQTAWRSQNWVVKNLFELKNARRVTIRGNIFEYNWPAAQNGFAILFTVRNQDGACPWCQVEDVLFAENVVRHVSAGVNILGYDDLQPSLQTRRITIRNNLFIDVDNLHWGGNKGYFVQLLNGPADVTVDHNTVIQDHVPGIIWAEGPPISGFRFTNNLTRHNLYGFIGNNHAPGADTITAYFPDGVITNNAIADANPAQYPAGNLFPTSAEFQTEFVSYLAGDFRLLASSVWRTAASDGRELGAPLGTAASQVRVTLDIPGNGSSVRQPITIAGWALDEGNPGGTGVDAVHVYAYPNPGSGQPAIFLGTAQVGGLRPDLAQIFGARFGTAGFSLSARGLAPGNYQIVAFAHGTLSEQFTAAASTVTVQSTTELIVDYPPQGASLRQPFNLVGWAVDSAAQSGTGIDAVQVWAYPSAGGAPLFAGTATLGLSRPDVGAAFGSSQFTPSGYTLAVKGLPPGDYNLVVFARSTVANAFISRVVPVRLTQTAEVIIDRPASNASVTTADSITGWSVDTAAPSGTGISTLHVWAYPAAGGAPTFAGVANYGSARSDIGGIFGAQFVNSGYSLQLNGLAPGAYIIVVYGYSTVTNAFSVTASVRVVISG